MSQETMMIVVVAVGIGVASVAPALAEAWYDNALSRASSLVKSDETEAAANKQAEWLKAWEEKDNERRKQIRQLSEKLVSERMAEEARKREDLSKLVPPALERVRETGHLCEEVTETKFWLPALEITCITKDGGRVVTYVVTNFGLGAVGVKDDH
jgi:hypothetical protein